MQSIGSILRNRRQSLNMSLKDVEKSTKIRVRYLQAIENDDYSILPAPVYVRGFIRVYARTLGIDPKYIMDVYNQTHDDRPPTDEEFEESPKRELVEEGRHPEEPRSRMRRRAVERGIFFKRRLFLIMVALAFLLILIFVIGPMIFGGQRRTKVDETAPTEFSIDEVNRKKAVEDPTQIQPEEAGAAPSADELTPPAEENPSGFTLELTATDRVWLKVTLDGKVVYEDTMEEGASRTWEAKLNAKVRSGNGELIQVKKDGVELGKLGVGLEEKTFTK